MSKAMTTNPSFELWLSKQGTMAQSAAYHDWLQMAYEAGVHSIREPNKDAYSIINRAAERLWSMREEGLEEAAVLVESRAESLMDATDGMMDGKITASMIRQLKKENQ